MTERSTTRCYCDDRPRSAETPYCRPCQTARAKLLGLTRDQLGRMREKHLLALARIESVLNPPEAAVST